MGNEDTMASHRRPINFSQVVPKLGPPSPRYHDNGMRPTHRIGISLPFPCNLPLHLHSLVAFLGGKWKRSGRKGRLEEKKLYGGRSVFATVFCLLLTHEIKSGA